MKRFKKWLSLSLALLMLLSAAAVFAGCGQNDENTPETNETLGTNQEEELEDNRFQNVNFNDRVLLCRNSLP